MVKSFVIVGILLFAAIFAVFGIFSARDWMARQDDKPLLQKWGPILCALANAGQISVMNYVYKLISRWWVGVWVSGWVNGWVVGCVLLAATYTNLHV